MGPDVGRTPTNTLLTRHVRKSHAVDGLLTAERPTTHDVEPRSRRRRRTRRARRVAVRCGCWLFQDGATVFGNTVDLAAGGLFLRTALPLPPGTQVDVRLELPDMAEAVLASGLIVRHVRPSDGGRPGLGVRFEDVSQGAEELSSFTQRRDL